MILDGHIHISAEDKDPAPMLERMHAAGVDGGVILSAMPENMDPGARPYEARLEQILTFCRDEKYLFPFFFINPVAEDVLEQIDRAVEEGIAGFKIICNRFYPGDPRCVEACRHIASYRKPVLFHSGILWDGKNPSGNYNKPTEFEPLLPVDGLDFALAHISWPWCDECIAVYGKFNNAVHTGKEIGSRMFVDNTPGTPMIYRRDALTRLLFAGYDILGNLFFGTDNSTGDYNVEWAKSWIAADTKIYDELGLTPEQIQGIFSGNLLNFVKEAPKGQS